MTPSDYVLKPSAVRLDKTLGYAYLLDASHPLANRQGKVYVHRHMASVKLGRWLEADEHVHHKNRDRYDNSLENLEVVKNSEHAALHAKERPKQERKCSSCGKATKNKSFCSKLCRRKVDRPSKEELERLLQSVTWEEAGRLFGVSSTAIRKWARG